MKLITKLFLSCGTLGIMALVLFTAGCTFSETLNLFPAENISRFSSDEALLDAFKNARESSARGYGAAEMALSAPTAANAGGAQKSTDTAEYSATNVQVEGVDENDTVKTDGEYVYAVTGWDAHAGGESIVQIARAYPAGQAEVLSTIADNDYIIDSLLVNGDRLLVLGSKTYNGKDDLGKPITSEEEYYYPFGMMSARVYDISDRAAPKFIQKWEIEGDLLTARLIGDIAYVVVNEYPSWDVEPLKCGDIIPLMYQGGAESPAVDDFAPIVKCAEVGYLEPNRADQFIIVAALPLSGGDMEKEVVVGNGSTVYASTDNLYVTQTDWDYGRWDLVSEAADTETVVSKFALNDGGVAYQATGRVPGTVLNQFSLDESEDYFRVATTVGEVWNESDPAENNIYVLDKDLEIVGRLENLAPGERIYSARFMGERAYLVTFKKIDPLFVIDLSTPTAPAVLGKLKIPGFSDYLHPYDENHIIGIGKDTEEPDASEVELRGLDFAWYQGLKLALFDVSDVAHPKELYKELIGDRGTDSAALADHKAFLFSRAKNLLVLPVTLAEIQGARTSLSEYGETVYQGAYVYELTVDEGFKLRGRITHLTSVANLESVGMYIEGENEEISRSFYIEDALYTVSGARFKVNNLSDLAEIKSIDWRNI